ncbi:DeoR/GlpR family DNA-binding transcription regulator [Kitasatospora sp. NPDC057015]|uniref:DeoR/GlpR family DNA-binding transcription regulator n=1 Tax=Kitasatospora sp. NPDC057015 TaxID=3346001 RepID=UPI0036280168
MGAHDRWTRLLDVLGERGSLDIAEAAELLDCSTTTIRRDLDALARQMLLTRTHGGAALSAVTHALPLSYRTARRAGEKQRIAKAAADLIPRGSTVGINGGSTTSEVARELSVRSGLADEPGAPALTVVTNAINIAVELAIRPQIKLVVTGGIARSNSYELIGPLAALSLRGLSLDYAVLGVDGVHPHSGTTTHDQGEAAANRALAECAATVIVVADSSKLGGQAFAQVCPTSSVSVLVTDSDAPNEITEQFVSRNISVLRV